MMLITAAVAVPFAVTAHRFAWLNRHLATASGVLSLAFGLWMAYQIGVVDGLFSARRTGRPSSDSHDRYADRRHRVQALPPWLRRGPRSGPTSQAGVQLGWSVNGPPHWHAIPERSWLAGLPWLRGA